MEVAEPVRSSLERRINISRIEACLDDLSERYDRATPWRHLVIDDFLEPAAARRAAAAFPLLPAAKSRLARVLGARSHKASFAGLDPILDEIFDDLHGPRMTAVVERITRVGDLRPDRTLSGAGLHQGARGSHLRLHADHNTHPSDANRFRRVNVMVYLNEAWNPDWNGALELWSRDASACRLRIEPVFNRAVVMSVDDTAYHGYGPLRLPKNRTRNALATYYYTRTPAEGQQPHPHYTVWPIIPGAHPLEPFVHRTRMFVLSRLRKP